MLGASYGRVVHVLIGAAALVALLCAVAAFQAQKEHAVLVSIEEHIVAVRTTLRELEEATSRNMTIPEIENILIDCEERSEYEGMLNSLNTLPQSELARALLLADLCGDFFALKKRVMAEKLRTTVHELASYVELYEAYSRRTLYAAPLVKWRTIAALESTRANLLTEQASVQKDIIQALVSHDALRIAPLLTEAGRINQGLEAQAGQIERDRRDEESLWQAVQGAR